MSRAFTFDGRPVPFQDGDSVAAALLRAGVVSFRHSVSGAPRGGFCGIGVCFDCTVEIDELGTVRACVEPALPGQIVRSTTAGDP